MASLLDFGQIFKTLREVDLNSLRQEAEKQFMIAVVGRANSGKTTLITQMRMSDQRGTLSSAPVVSEHELETLGPYDLDRAQLVVLLLDSTRSDLQREREVFDSLRQSGKLVLVLYNRGDQVSDSGPVTSTMGYWSQAEVEVAAAIDRDSLKRRFVPAVLRLWPSDLLLSLARHLPLFRSAVVKRLIDETSMANATFSLTTGLAEIVPLLDIPVVMGDMLVLTKNQALMAYKIALAEGLDADWKHTLPEVAGVIGAGFAWRQMTRELIGLIPIWGLVPKVAIAYSGTYATGRAVQFWAETGEKMSAEGFQAIVRDALERGRGIASRLTARRTSRLTEIGQRLHLPALPGRSQATCPACGAAIPPNSRFCPKCGTALPGSNS